MSDYKNEKLILILQKSAFYVLSISILGEIIQRVLIILNFKNIEDGYVYYYALLLKFILIFIYKHKYWITSATLLFVSDLLEIVVINVFKPSGNTIKYGYYDIKTIVSVVGIILLLIALVYCIKIWRKRDRADYFVFKKLKVH